MKVIDLDRWFTVRTIGILIGAGIFAAPAAAQSTLEERVSGADSVVVATARAVTASWQENEHGDRLIVSRVLLEVDETMKGANARTMWLEVDGGTLDGYTLKVSGLHMPEIGERALYILDAGDGSVRKPHLRGLGILPLDNNDVIRGTAVRLTDVRARMRNQGL